MKFKETIATLLLTLAIFQIIHPPPVRSQDDVPNFFYHSKEQQAFIISQPGPNGQSVVVKTGYDYVYGPGPSPSYSWFSYAAGEMNPSELHVFAMSNGDGTEIGRIIDVGAGFYDHISWATETDILAFSFSRTEDLLTSVYVYHPETESVLQFTSQTSIGGYDNVYGIEWLSDDSGIAIYYGSTIEIFDLEGELIGLFEINPESAKLPSCDQDTVNTVLSERLVYIREGTTQLTIVDIDDRDSTVKVELPSDQLDTAFWSPNEQYVLLFFPRPRTTVIAGYDVWVYSIEANTLNKLDLRAGVVMPTYCDGRYGRSPWSGQVVALVTTDSELFLVDADTGTAVSITTELSGRLNSLGPIQWNSTDQVLNFIWFDADNGNTVYAYEVDTQNSYPLVPVNREVFASFDFFALNTDGLIAYNDGGLIVDSTSGRQIVSLDIEYPDDGVYGVGNVSWHPSMDWLVVTTSLAGTDVVGRFTVVDVKNGVQQFLTDCPVNQPACFGWLP